MSDYIEMRSDTFTRPTPPMRQAIAEAEVGDDVAGEDPTVNRLEAFMAELSGKEAAVFACSGTQSNQMAIWAHCQRGDELLIELGGHIANYEAGAPAVLSGVTVRKIHGDAGRLDVPHLEANYRATNLHLTPTSLLCLENTTNLGGGRTYPLDQIQRVCEWAHERGWKTHLDGARVFNACIAQGYTLRDVAQYFDTVSICFSKGLGCPMGSILVGSATEIGLARRARKIFGGALRQAGIPAAACLYALEHNVDRLAEDHLNAQIFAQLISDIDGISVDLDAIETNLVFFEVDPAFGTAASLAQLLKERGVRINPLGGNQRLRACTHLDVNADDVQQAAAAIRDCMQQGLSKTDLATADY